MPGFFSVPLQSLNSFLRILALYTLLTLPLALSSLVYSHTPVDSETPGLLKLVFLNWMPPGQLQHQLITIGFIFFFKDFYALKNLTIYLGFLSICYGKKYFFTTLSLSYFQKFKIFLFYFKFLKSCCLSPQFFLISNHLCVWLQWFHKFNVLLIFLMNKNNTFLPCLLVI